MAVTSTDFDRLPIPFRAVAADIATGEAVVISSGNLAQAMRASMSVPGALPPVTFDGRELVDGGVAANLPIGIAKDLGAGHIIAVDISSPLLSKDEELGSFLQIYQHLNSLLNAFFEGQSLTWNSLQTAWSLFLGGDTFIGPVIIGYGHSGGRPRPGVLLDRPPVLTRMTT